MGWPPEFPDEEEWSVEEQLIGNLLKQLNEFYPVMSEDDLIIAGLEELINENKKAETI